MVRTYRQDRYQLVSPWEKAMRTADQEEGRPVNTGKRVYADMKVTQSSLAHNPGQKNLKLPPITEDPQQMISFLGEEVGKCLARSKGKIKTIKKELILYDPSDSGLMSKTAAFEILQRYKIPSNENYKKKILAFFVDQDLPGKINHKKLMEFFENSRKGYLEKTLSQDNQTGESGRTDGTHGRYDSLSTMNGVENKPRKAHEQAFKERRDVGLLLEIEKALKNYRKSDPTELLDNLEDSLRRTCRSDDLLTDTGHVKSLVFKNEIPINTALTMKCIDRLDPYDTGKVEWPKFVDFLRKAIGASPTRTPKTPKTPLSIQYAPSSIPYTQQSTPNEFVPEKPAWETRQPLSQINSHNEDNNYNHSNQSHNDDGYNEPQMDHHGNSGNWGSGGNNDNSYGADTDNRGSGGNNDNSYDANTGYSATPSAPTLEPEEQYAPHDYLADYNNNYNDNTTNNNYNQDANGYDNTNNQYNDPFQQTDDDLEAAFTRNIEEIRKGFQEEEEQAQPSHSFERMGERGELYKRVANALEDKAKPTNGMLLTNDVRKIVNYYNLLFDANFPMDQINSLLQRFSKNDEINCGQVCDMLGKQIV